MADGQTTLLFNGKMAFSINRFSSLAEDGFASARAEAPRNCSVCLSIQVKNKTDGRSVGM